MRLMMSLIMSQIIRRRRNERGNILMVMIVSILLASLSLVVVAQIANHYHLFARSLAKTKTNYEAEGIVKMIERISQLYFETNIVYDNQSLTNFIAPYIPSIQPTNYQILDWKVDISPTDTIANIRSGSFKGMQSDSRVVKYWLTLKELANKMQTSIYIEGSISAITFTQFSAFSFGDFLSWSGVNSLIFNGRVHTNGNFCGGGNPEMDMQYLTAAGSIFHLNNAGSPCGPTYGYTLQVKISNGTLNNALIPNATSGCTNCAGTGLSWGQYAMNRWNGHVQDNAFGVPKLKLPLTSTPQVQNVFRYGDPVGLNQPERFLIDPVRAIDGADVKSLKFANRADIRIINGTWYLRNPANPSDWPGIPVWSDHPGSFTTTDEEGIEGFNQVGQDDIKAWFTAKFKSTAKGDLTIRWAAGETPKKFSYYEFDSIAGHIKDNTEGIVSYGNLYRKAVNQWIPGFYAMNGATSNVLCPPAVVCSDAGCTGSPNLIRSFNAPLACADGSAGPSRGTRLLNSTRSGFRFGMWMEAGLPTTESDQKSKILPMNFDVQALQDALKCNFDPANPASDHPGELGCYFTSWGLMGREFNGVIYITNTWKNQMQGFGSSHAGRQPYMHGGPDADFSPGTNIDGSQVDVSHPAQERALPFELCSTSRAGQAFDTNALFKIPDCAQYDLSSAGTSKLRTRPSDIRVVNASQIDHTILTHGLSIVSNVNLFLQGDTNINSDTSSATATPWTPMLIGANNLLLLSSAWSDDSDRWDVSPVVLLGQRKAESTQYNLVMITGQFPFFLNEDWRTKTTHVRSPLLLFYDPAFDNIGASVQTGDMTFYPGGVDMLYDNHFEFLANQPPGVPFMNIFSTNGWLIK